jgi:Fur family ferric uptake transcriptional regulator
MRSYATKQRKAIEEALALRGDGVFSARDLAEGLKNEGVSLSAVYRNLASLEKEGRAVRVPREGEAKYYRYVPRTACRMHLHLACKDCGKTFHMDVPATERIVEEAREEAGFEIDRKSTVLVGVCRECRERR